MRPCATLQIDSVTAAAIKRLAGLWDVPDIEVVRRAIAQAEAPETDALSPLKALDWLQCHGTLTEAKLREWEDSQRETPVEDDASFRSWLNESTGLAAGKFTTDKRLKQTRGEV